MKKTFALLAITMLLTGTVGCSNKQVSVNTNSNKIIPSEEKNISESSKPEPAKDNLSTKTDIDVKELKYNDEGVPVIMYHSVKYEKNNPVRIPKENFEAQMKFLKDNGYTTLSLDELYGFLENNTPVPKKSVVLTFDDGYKDNYETAYPILKKYGFKATIFVITNCIDTGEYLTTEQLKELQANGIDIESHTLNHEKLTTLPYDKQLATLKESKENLEKLLNKEVKYFAYPFGKYNDNTIKATKEAGYKLALTTNGKWSDKSDGILTLDRVYISGTFDINIFQYRITNPNYN